MSQPNKSHSPCQNGDEAENEEPLSDSDVDRIVGVGDNLDLEVPYAFCYSIIYIVLQLAAFDSKSLLNLILQVMDPPCTLHCELRPYQKQALHWMVQLEKGRCMDEAATTLHPCWEAYRLADKYGMFAAFFHFSICWLRVGSPMIFTFSGGILLFI